MILEKSTQNQVIEYAKMVKTSAHHLIELVNDILDISKIEAGRMELMEESYALDELITDIVTMMDIKAQDKGLKLKVQVDPKLPSHLYGDCTKLRQIVINLLNNAVKYTRKGAVALLVSGVCQENQVALKLQVRDTGIGIKEEDLQKIFDSFQQVDSKRNRNMMRYHMAKRLWRNMSQPLLSDLQLYFSQYFTDFSADGQSCFAVVAGVVQIDDHQSVALVKV